jgi:serine phosphatase RsbU (regulator of sigma subunit)
LAVPILTAVMGLFASVRNQQDQLLIVVAGYRLQIFEVASLLIAAIVAWLLLRDLTAERARFTSELEAGRAVQQLLLSGGGTPAGVEAVWQPASEVGGDFWQAIPLAGSSRLIVVGDVSGKGLKAAMIVSLLTGALRNRRSDSPAQLLAELNAAVQGGGGFVTCCITRLEPDGRLTAANAGHPAPYLNGQELELAPGLPLGVVPEAEYTEAAFSFDGQLTLVSDGVIEAANASGKLFGFDRTREISTKSAQAIADAAQQWGQNDDITVVTVRRSA